MGVVMQRHHNTDDRVEYEVLNNIVRDMCGGLRVISFGNKLRALRPGHRSFWSFTRIIKNKFGRIPALKLDGLTLITKSEKADWLMVTPYDLSCSLQSGIAAPFSIAMHSIMIYLHTRD
jgi:hypothetical protein